MMHHDGFYYSTCAYVMMDYKVSLIDRHVHDQFEYPKNRGFPRDIVVVCWCEYGRCL